MELLHQIMLLCRAGFESECAAEIMQQASARGFAAYVKAAADSGRVLMISADGRDTSDLLAQIDFRTLVFARQWFACGAQLGDLPDSERTVPLVTHASQISQSLNSVFADVELSYADTNEGRSLSRFCTAFRPHLLNALKQHALINPRSRLRLHLCFADSSAAWLGISHSGNHARQPMGIPRLRMPPTAPSRSTLKLDEAIQWFLGSTEQRRLLKPGMHAVDLGAAPGGWTWQLVKRGLLVTAVDNGPMDKTLMENGMVTHRRTDAFTFEPERRVDWLVCDMAERPVHVSRLIARWFVRKHTGAAIFNLKLPMKKRYHMVMECKQLIDNTLATAGIAHELQLKHLYHDREEITACLRTDTE